MEQLHHNGVMVPPKYQGTGLTVEIKGETVELKAEQEERAMAWAKKIGTPYVEDSKFAENFHEDFSLILGRTVFPGDVDYTAIHQIVLDEREQRANRRPSVRRWNRCNGSPAANGLPPCCC